MSVSLEVRFIKHLSVVLCPVVQRGILSAANVSVRHSLDPAVHTGCFAILGRYVDTGANLGKQGVGDEIFVSRPRFARLGYFSAYSVVHFS